MQSNYDRDHFTHIGNFYLLKYFTRTWLYFHTLVSQDCGLFIEPVQSLQLPVWKASI